MVIGLAILVVVLLVAAAILWAYITNPFSRLSVIRQPLTVAVQKKRLIITNENHRITLRQNIFWRTYAVYVKCFVHVLATRYLHSPASRSTTVEGIIADIHAHRFKRDRLLLTSGDHFSALFVRNLGVFYYPMLDTRIKSSQKDWEDRQIVYLQTVGYALGVFAKHRVPVTTIVSTGPRAATCVNIYAYPSDALYGVLYALAALLGKEPATPVPHIGKARQTLQTTEAAGQLLTEYKDVLADLYTHYRQTVFDPQTGLIRKDIHLSGAKDITRRTCAFFDNVIFWKTTQLAAELGIIPKDATFLRVLKQRILKTFWLEAEGHFLEDLSEESLEHHYYSSDWLIALVTGFLSPENARERKYFARSVSYIRAHDIDKPFAVKYQHETRAHRQFFWVRLVMASYGGDAIWSFWGMEYIKTLLLLYKETKDASYLEAADFHIAAYERAMLRDRGFPEVYDKDGNLLQTLIYRSIRQTGWVIGFEQVRTLRAAIARAAARS